MSDLIRREDAVEAIYEALRTPLPNYNNDFFHDSMSIAMAMANNIPSAEPEQKKGKWIYDTQCVRRDGRIISQFRCSECGIQGIDALFNFCPYCGADMRGDR